MISWNFEQPQYLEAPFSDGSHQRVLARRCVEIREPLGSKCGPRTHP